MSGPGYAKPEPMSARERCSDPFAGKREVNWCNKVEGHQP